MSNKADKNQNINTLEAYLKEGNVSFYGYTDKEPLNFIFENKKGRARFFIKIGRQTPFKTDKIPFFQYGALAEMREQGSDIYFLDNEAVKVMFAEFPGSAHYVLIRLIPRLSWLIALPGFLRRLYIGLVRIEGVITLSAGKKSTKWLVLRHMLARSLNTRLSLSSEVGVQGFLDHLRKEKIKYVILRFYEKLPALYRSGGDLDVLVTDEDDYKVRAFLQKNPGEIGIDVWTPSRTSYNSITYYPPPLARKIIESAVDGPAGSKIPSPKESFLSLAYHAIYHKGFFAGIPSQLHSEKANKNPENDYAGVLASMARELGVDVEMTMESLDEYLDQEGWRPKLDTLAKIAPRNEWVWDRFFSSEKGKEIGLGVFIIKRKALEDGIADKIISTIAGHDEFMIVRTKIFNNDEVKRVAEHLRGGVWDDASGASQDYLPAVAVVVFDKNLARFSKINMMHDNSGKRIRELKKVLRKKYDSKGVSLVHATDNSEEAWEYLHWCFFGEKTIKKDVEEMYDSLKVSLAERIVIRIKTFPRYVVYQGALLKQILRGKIVRWLMS